MTKYTATFADGTTITRTSEREYGVAWRSTYIHPKGNGQRQTWGQGFAVSRDKVAATAPRARTVHKYMSSNDRAKAREANAAYLVQCGYQIEIVPTTTAA